MKIISVFIAISIIAFSTAHGQIVDNNLKAPATVPIKSNIQITQLDLVSDSSKPDGNGHKIYFDATITSTGVGIVSYQWIIKGNVGPVGNPPPPSVISGTLTLSGTGTDHVYRTVSYGSHGLTTIQFRTSSPVVALSPTRSY